MNEIKEYSWKLNIDEINYIISGLQELPAKVANPIIQKLHLQANEHFAREAAEKAAAESESSD
jgi:hypothetical protein